MFHLERGGGEVGEETVSRETRHWIEGGSPSAGLARANRPAVSSMRQGQASRDVAGDRAGHGSPEGA